MPPRTDFIAQFREWKKQCPLRLYRMKDRITMEEIAGALDCSVTSLQHYEAGRTRPNAERQQRIKDLLGEDRYKKWQKWQTARPLRSKAA